MAEEQAKIDDGGPAFPVAETHNIADTFPWTAGMTLRDYFAGQAMAAIIHKHGVLSYSNSYSNHRPKDEVSSERREIWESGVDHAPDINHIGTAHVAYEIADAMIATRKL